MDINKKNLTFSINDNKELENIISQDAKIIKVPSKKVFMYPNEEFECLYFIKSGKTRHYMSSSEGSEKILYVLTKGWFFGESTFVLGHGETSLYSKAEVDSELYLISKERAILLIDESKIFRDAIMKSFAYKILILRYEIENILFNPAKDRIKSFLSVNVNKSKMYDDKWYDINLEYTHREIGISIGCSRVTVSKMIQELIQDGFIRIVNNKIQVNSKMYFDYINE